MNPLRLAVVLLALAILAGILPPALVRGSERGRKVSAVRLSPAKAAVQPEGDAEEAPAVEPAPAPAVQVQEAPAVEPEAAPQEQEVPTAVAPRPRIGSTDRAPGASPVGVGKPGAGGGTGGSGKTGLIPLQWPADSLRVMLSFPKAGTGYSVKFSAPNKEVTDHWTSMFTAQSRSGCKYIAYISQGPAPLKNCYEGPISWGVNIVWNTGPAGKGGCTLKPGGAYLFNIMLADMSAKPQRPMYTVCEQWVSQQGNAVVR